MYASLLAGFTLPPASDLCNSVSKSFPLVYTHFTTVTDLHKAITPCRPEAYELGFGVGKKYQKRRITKTRLHTPNQRANRCSQRDSARLTRVRDIAMARH